jgi:hypothetical protein
VSAAPASPGHTEKLRHMAAGPSSLSYAEEVRRGLAAGLAAQAAAPAGPASLSYAEVLRLGPTRLDLPPLRHPESEKEREAFECASKVIDRWGGGC